MASLCTECVHCGEVDEGVGVTCHLHPASEKIEWRNAIGLDCDSFECPTDPAPDPTNPAATVPIEIIVEENES